MPRDGANTLLARRAPPSAGSGADEAQLRTRRFGEAALRDSAGEPCETPPFNSGAHRRRHPQRVMRLGDGGIGQHRVASQLHRQGRVRGRADASIEYHGDRTARAYQLDSGRISDPHARADQRAQRHDRSAPDIGELLTCHRVFIAIRKNGEPAADQLLSRTDELFDIGIERFTVADQFELHPISLERLARQLGGQNSITHSRAAGGVRQQPMAAPEQVYQALRVTLEADAPDRDGDNLGAARREAVEQYLLVWITGGADEKPRREGSVGDYQGVGHRAKSSKVASAARKRAHNFDIVARRQGPRRPFRPAYNGAVHGDGEKSSRRVYTARDEEL